MKRGISLIAVLMFMLAATAASIVLFKWIGSENFLSGARLKQSEAYQASESGLDAVQAWLSYKAADAGSLIKEHLKSGNPKRSYQLNHPSNDVLGNFGAGNQNFEVYLIGADITSKPYKLKFLSIGKGRDNSEVRQTAIFNVEGLYITDIPHDMTVRPPGQPTEYNEDFWGNMGTAHSLQSMRMVMTQTAELKNAGGMGLNKITIGTANEPGYLILDGDYYTNNGIKVYGDTYVTGNYDLCSSGPNEITGNLYIGEAFHARISSGYLNVGGSAYFGGDVNPNSPPKSGCGGSSGGTITIKGNSTINGDFVYWNNGSGGSLGFNVEKNLVMDKGKIDLTRQTNNANTLAAEGNVYIANPLTGTIPSGGATGPIPLFGNTSSNTVCVSGMNCPNSGSPKTCTSNNIQMKTNANQTYDNLALCSGWQDWGADPMDGSKSDKDLLAKLREGSSSLSCENTPIKFDMDIYEAAIKNPPDGTPYFVHKTGTPRSCAVQDGKLRIDYPWVNLDQELKACWNTASSNNQLYNGEWLVVYLKNYQYKQPGKSNSPLCDKTSGKCKYIIIFDFDYTPPGDNFIYLPPTGDNAEVMIFLPKGSPHIISLEGGTAGNNCDTENGSCWIDAKYNYFIFSDGDIKQFNTTGNRKLTGNVFMNRCSIMNLPGVQGNPYFMSQGNTDLVAELTALRILLKNDGSGFTGGSGNTATEVDERKDNYIIPLSPRLKVELESKYISKEKPVSPNETSPSVLVMPRVLRLPTNSGVDINNLRNYYNLLYLNWKAPTKPELSSLPTPTCSSINPASAFPGEGAYTCTHSNVSGAPVSEFYVKIQNSTVLQDSDDPTSPAETGSSSSGTSSSSSSLSSSSLSSSSSDNAPFQAIGCDYNPSWCGNIPIENVVRNKSYQTSGWDVSDESSQPRCIFALQVFNLGNHGMSCDNPSRPNNYQCESNGSLAYAYAHDYPIKVNGQILQQHNQAHDGYQDEAGRCGGNGQNWQSQLLSCSEAIARQNIQRVDGGYYVYLPPGWVNQNFQLAGGSPVCAGAASSSSGGGEGGAVKVIGCTIGSIGNPNGNCYDVPRPSITCSDGSTAGTTVFQHKQYSTWENLNGWSSSGSSMSFCNPGTRGIQLIDVYCGTTHLTTNSSDDTGLPYECGNLVIPPSGGGETSSSSVTITCKLKDRNGSELAAGATLNVTQGENINAPVITCSNGNAGTSGASFSASSGVLPENSANWKNNNPTYYGTTSNALGSAGNTITVSGVTCGGSGSYTASCGTIKVSKPTCTLSKSEYAVNETITPTVNCGNNVSPSHSTFSGTNWQNTSTTNNASGKFTTATTGSNTRKLTLADVICNSHTLNGVNNDCTPEVKVSSSSSASCGPTTNPYVMSEYNSVNIGTGNNQQKCLKMTCNNGTLGFGSWNGSATLKLTGGCSINSYNLQNLASGAPHVAVAGCNANPGDVYIEVLSGSTSSFQAECKSGSGGGNTITIAEGDSGNGTTIPAPSGNGEVTYTITCTNTTKSLDCDRGSNTLLRFKVNNGSWVTQSSNNNPVKVMDPCVNGTQVTIDFGGDSGSVTCNNKGNYW